MHLFRLQRFILLTNELFHKKEHRPFGLCSFLLTVSGFAPPFLRQPLAAAEGRGERTEVPPVAEKARMASEKIRGVMPKYNAGKLDLQQKLIITAIFKTRIDNAR